MRKKDITLAGEAPVLYAVGTPTNRRDHQLRPAYVLEIGDRTALVLRTWHPLRYGWGVGKKIMNVDEASKYSIIDVQKRRDALAKAAAKHPDNWEARREASIKATEKLRKIPENWQIDQVPLTQIQMDWSAWEQHVKAINDAEEKRRLDNEKQAQENERRAEVIIKKLKRAGIPEIPGKTQSARWGNLELPLESLEAIVEKLG